MSDRKAVSETIQDVGMSGTMYRVHSPRPHRDCIPYRYATAPDDAKNALFKCAVCGRWWVIKTHGTGITQWVRVRWWHPWSKARIRALEGKKQ